MNYRALILPTLIIGSAAPSASAAISLTDTFSGPTLNPALEVSAANKYTISGGSVSNTNGQKREYIRTVATDFRSTNFTMSLTYTVANGFGGTGIAFIGLGSGAPAPAFYSEPLLAVYFRSMPSDFAGAVNPSINSGGSSVSELSAIGTAGSGTHRARLIKIGNTLTFVIDIDSSGGDFTSDASTSFDLSELRFSFLNDTNSRLFFGTQAGTSFSEVTIEATPSASAVPEPANCGILGGTLLLALVSFRRRSAH